MFLTKKIFFILSLIISSFYISQCSFFQGPSISLDVEEITLANGLKAILVKKEGPPVFAGYIRFRVGGIEESEGYSGLAHFFEHMAFKGTSKIGVKDYEKEREILDEIHLIGTRITTLKKNNKNQEKINELENQLKNLQEKHQELLDKNEFVQIYQRNGGSNINATTSNDYTSYFISLPSNKLELWAYMESQRIKDPILREFFKERDVVAEERRMRYDNSPKGKLFEEYLNLAFDESPYKLGAIGKPEDIQAYTPEVARKFFYDHYIPSRMVIALVGNFDREEAKNYIQKYFGDLSNHGQEEKKRYQTPLASDFPRSKAINFEAEPRLYMGFHRPAHPHPSDEVFDVIDGLLCQGRTSVFYQKLVLDEKLVSDLGCSTSLPGSRLDGLFTIYAVPIAPHTNQEVEKRIMEIIDEYKSKEIDKKELERIRTRIEADLIFSLDSNMGLASLLTYFESLAGSWTYIHNLPNKISKVDVDDIHEVMKKYFVKNRKVVVYLERKVDEKN
jgi:predicted Zn-dependent peptidase